MLASSCQRNQEFDVKLKGNNQFSNWFKPIIIILSQLLQLRIKDFNPILSACHFCQFQLLINILCINKNCFLVTAKSTSLSLSKPEKQKKVVDLQLVTPVIIFQKLTKIKCWKIQNSVERENNLQLRTMRDESSFLCCGASLAKRRKRRSRPLLPRDRLRHLED